MIDVDCSDWINIYEENSKREENERMTKLSIVKNGRWTKEALELGFGCNHKEHQPKENSKEKTVET